MPRFTMFRPGWTNRAPAALDALLYGLSAYGVPAVIALMSLVALLAFDKQYTIGAGSPIEFRVFEQTGDAPTPAQALAQLDDQPPVPYRDTRLSESPFWFSFTVRPPDGDRAVDVELP